MSAFDDLFAETIPCGWSKPLECAYLSRERYPGRREAARVMTEELIAMGYLDPGDVIEPWELCAEWVRYRWPGEEDCRDLEPGRHYWLPSAAGPGAKPVWVWE